MSIRILLSALVTLLITNYTAAQTIAVDMDTASGIQATVTSRDTAQLITVQVRISGAVNLFSYQYKVAFDTTKLSFAGAQLDAGPLGEKNLLTRNGGGVNGVYQLQLNPPASDTIEISGTILSNDPARSVSGDGLIGVIYFKSTTTPNDSTAITASNGSTAIYNGDLTPVTAYASGGYRVTPPVALSPDRLSDERSGGAADHRAIFVAIGNSIAAYDLSPAGAVGTPLTFRLFTPDGKCIATCSVPFTAATRHISVPLSRIASPLSAGIYIGSIGVNGRTVSQMIRIQ